MSSPLHTTVSDYKRILNDPNVQELMKRLDLHPFPIDFMNRLEVGKPYDIYLVHDRLKQLGVIDYDVEVFRNMIDSEEGFRIARNNVFRVGKKKTEYRTELDIDLE